MSNSYNYLPNPPRVWSRVQNPCTYIVPDNSYNSIYIPLTNQTVSLAQANLEEKIQYKGNILQYKGNSSRITKNQRYAQISKGMWCNRTKVFATQTQTYTNPNTISLARVNFTSIPFPNQIVGSPNNISGPFQYGIPNPNNCNTTTIQDGGSLLCGSYANPCTGEIVQTVSEQQCFPTYCSDVPGKIMNLCWNPKLQTFFPKNRLTMSNSLNKWPQGYKGLQSALIEAVPNPPLIVSSTSNYYDVTIEWTYTNVCSTISGFNIYQNGELIQTVPYQIKSTTMKNLDNCQSYTYYVTAFNSVGESVPSNVVNATIFVPLPPTITSITQINTSTTISWVPNLNCSQITNYLLYENNKLINILPSNETTITLNLTTCGVYTFYLVSYNSNTNVSSLQSNIASTSVVPLPPILSGTPTGFTSITLNWVPAVTCAPITGWNIYNSPSGTLLTTITDATITTYVVTGLTSGSTYSYYVNAIYSGGVSANSNTVSVTLPQLFSYSGATLYVNNGYTGLVFDYSTNPIQQYVQFNATTAVNILVVGGGGAGWQALGASAPGGVGGGGGGIYYNTNYSLLGNYSVAVGYPGTFTGSASPVGQQGGNSVITSSSLVITATGGEFNNTSNSVAAGGGYTATNSSPVVSNGGNGGYGFVITTPTPPPTYPQITSTNSIIPFLGTSSLNLPFVNGTGIYTMNLSGGGGQGNDYNTTSGTYFPDNGPGGAPGNGVGGAFGGNSNQNGGDALNSSIFDCISVNSCGGGGGGTTGFGDPLLSGGNGGAGAVILWWTTI